MADVASPEGAAGSSTPGLTKPDPTPPTRWQVVQRLQEYRGESIVNLVRVAGILAFYSIEILNHRGSALLGMPAVVDDRLHALVTALVGAWVGVSILTLIALRLRVFPPALKYVSAASDIALMTATLSVLDGPRSPMLLGFLLIIALSSLRLSRRLIWFTSLGSLVGYAALVIHADALRPALSVPRYHQLIFCVAAVLLGAVLSLLVRAVEGIVREQSAGRGPEGGAS